MVKELKKPALARGGRKHRRVSGISPAATLIKRIHDAQFRAPPLAVLFPLRFILPFTPPPLAGSP